MRCHNILALTNEADAKVNTADTVSPEHDRVVGKRGGKVDKEGVASIITRPDFVQHHDDKKYNIFAGILTAIENGGKSDITIMAQLAFCVQVQQRIASEVSAVIDIVGDSF
jgi:hypothetical protein